MAGLAFKLGFLILCDMITPVYSSGLAFKMAFLFNVIWMEQLYHVVQYPFLTGCIPWYPRILIRCYEYRFNKKKDKNLSRDMMNELTRLSVVKTWVNQLLSYSWFWKKDVYADISKESCGFLSFIDEPSPVVSCRHKFFLHWINGEMAFRANN